MSTSWGRIFLSETAVPICHEVVSEAAHPFTSNRRRAPGRFTP
jgi:hypothetical protein